MRPGCDPLRKERRVRCPGRILRPGLTPAAGHGSLVLGTAGPGFLAEPGAGRDLQPPRAGVQAYSRPRVVVGSGAQ